MAISQQISALGASLELIHSRSMSDEMTLVTLSSNRGETSMLISKRGIREVEPADYVLAPKERITPPRSRVRKVFRVISNVVAWFLTLVLLTFIGLNVSGVIQARIIQTESMTPAIKPGDVVITLSPKNRVPRIGDVVTYQGRRLDGTPVALFSHRIIDGNAENGFVVQGDANPSPDTQKPILKDIIGVVVMTIPWAGHLLDPKILTLVMLTLFGLWLLRDAFREDS
jgi:signal peptidase I